MTRVKICGTTREEDIHLCVRYGVDAVGFVVEYPVEVPWNIAREPAKELISKVPPFVSRVVVVGGGLEHILSIAETTMPDALQLHGDESVEETAAIVDYARDRQIQVIKAVRVKARSQDIDADQVVKNCKEFAQTGISALLLDSRTEAMPAGTGVPFDWEIAKQVKDALTVPLILAGGLNVENVGKALEWVDPFGVDVISSVEAEPGRKHVDKVRAFVEAVRSLDKRHNRLSGAYYP
ncbi:MAG: tRNA-dihydrouridine synthase, partial [Anaerolineae bacterium]